jgi:Rod binding domain-containing protein
MDNVSGLLLTEATPMPALLEDGKRIASASADKQIKAVKDFESVFITKLLDAMESTIGDWGLEKDATSKQVRGIFSMFLGRHLGQSGGFGLWKDIYKSLNNTDNTNKTIESGG